jgi:hypothetical protein
VTNNEGIWIKVNNEKINVIKMDEHLIPPKIKGA